MAFYNNFSLQHVLSEAPPSTTDLQSVKETTISSNNQKPIPKFNKKKHNAVESETSKTITPSENQQQAHKHLLSVTAHDKALQSPYPSKNQQRKTSQKNHRQSKKNNARKATEQHNDKPREILDLDFDTLLSYHEKAKPSKNAPIQDKPVFQSENKKVSPNHNIYDVASEILGCPVKRPNESAQSEQLTKKQKQNAQKLYNEGQPNQKDASKKQKIWVPKRSCVFFTKGFCKDADQCTFKHDIPPPAETLKVCQFYKTGSCVKGNSCPYSHNLKLEPCRFYHMEGKCDNQNSCPYSHEPLNDDLRARLRKMTGPCRFYLFKGYCTSGDNCLFSHEDCTEEEKKKVESNILACRFYHTTGQCRSGDDCFYLHDEATPEQIQKVKQEHNKIS